MTYPEITAVDPSTSIQEARNAANLARRDVSCKQREELVFSPDGRLEKEEVAKKPKEHRGAAKAEVEQMEAKEHPQ